MLAEGQPRVNHLCLRFDRTYIWQAEANASLPGTNNNRNSTLTQLQACGKQMSHNPEGTRGKRWDGENMIETGTVRDGYGKPRDISFPIAIS